MNSPDLLTAIEPPVEPSAEKPRATPTEENAKVLIPRAGVRHAGAAPTSDTDKFDWSEDDTVIIQEQLALAVYRNRADGIVVRQEARNWDEDDHFIILRDNEVVSILIATLQRELKRRR